MDFYTNKYIKYKNKYLNAKHNQYGGTKDINIIGSLTGNHIATINAENLNDLLDKLKTAKVVNLLNYELFFPDGGHKIMVINDDTIEYEKEFNTLPQTLSLYIKPEVNLLDVIIDKLKDNNYLDNLLRKFSEPSSTLLTPFNQTGVTINGKKKFDQILILYNFDWSIHLQFFNTKTKDKDDKLLIPDYDYYTVDDRITDLGQRIIDSKTELHKMFTNSETKLEDKLKAVENHLRLIFNNHIVMVTI